MKAAGLAAFVPFTSNLEGVVPWMYLDVLGLVTVAIGNLCDPAPYALSLPFVRRDGTPATREEIAAQWQAVKNDPKAAKLGHRYAERLTSIRLTAEGISSVVQAKLRQNEAALVKRCPDFEAWPVDAQLALHSYAWAAGSAARAPRMFAALNAKDFATAAVECHLDERGPDKILGNADDNWGLKPRNVANKIMFRNAAQAMASGGMFDPEALIYRVPGGPLPLMPATHAAPRQSAVLPEEVTGSGGIIHPAIEWPSYRD